jgi:predicted permease
MNWWKRIFNANRREQELDAELRFHFDSQVEEKILRGMSREEALRSARIEFGGVSQIKEDCRESRRTMWLSSLGRDLRYALRSLLKSPILTGVVVVSLALGIGANTAVFSVMNAVLFKLLPVYEPERLLLLTWSAKGIPENFVNSLAGEMGESSSLDTYTALRSHNTVLEETMAFSSNIDPANVGVNGHASSASIQAVSANYFSGLGVQPSRGRAFSSNDDLPSAPPVAVISHKFWQQTCNGDPAILGKTLSVNGTAVTVVGVSPPEFFGLASGHSPDLFVPLRLYMAMYGARDNYPNAKVWWLTVVGRLKEGISEERAQADLAVLYQRALHVAGSPAASDPSTPRLKLLPASRGLNNLRSEYSTSLFLLMSMAGLVLLIACANVAGLLLARTSARQKEFAIRMSLGAARGRLIRQLLTESVLLGLFGGLAGLLVAKFATSTLIALLDNGRGTLALSVHLDARMLGFAAALSILCGVGFGLAPAIRTTAVDAGPLLKQHTGGVEKSGPRFLAGKLLVSGQVALCIVLLISAGLLLRTLNHLQTTELGFDQTNLLTFAVQPGLNGYKDVKLANYYQQLQQRIEALTGVQSVAVAECGPVGECHDTMGARTVDDPNGEKRYSVSRFIIGPKYFETLGVPVVLGRAIDVMDTKDAPLTIAVNEKLARQIFGGEDPLGRRLKFSGSIYRIVGVVKDLRYANVREDMPPTVYFSNQQRTSEGMTALVRLTGNPKPTVEAIQRLTLDLDKDVPMMNVRMEKEVIDQSFYLERTFATLSGVFGLLALILACIGLYGTIGYGVARRTNEIGIRMALGAGRPKILGMILRETFAVVLAGLAVGLPLMWLSVGLLKSQLYGISPHDPLTLLACTLTIVLITMMAGWIPARRASSIEPMEALRSE